MILPIITLLLIVISSLSWHAIYSNVLSYKSAAASQRMVQQFILSEYALSRAEDWLKHTPITQLPVAVAHCIQTPCIVLAQPAHYFPLQSAQWWQAVDNQTVNAVSLPLPTEYKAFYTVEQLTDANTPVETFYRITSWALLTGETTPIILQSTWKKSLNPSLIAIEERQAWRRW